MSSCLASLSFLGRQWGECSRQVDIKMGEMEGTWFEKGLRFPLPWHTNQGGEAHVRGKDLLFPWAGGQQMRYHYELPL